MGAKTDRRGYAVRCVVAGAVGLTLAVGTTESGAQTTPATQARAEALFQEGKALLVAGKLEEACLKLAASQSVDPAPGTLRNLGECYEKAGRSASAWITFQDAARAYRADAKPERVAEMQANVDRLQTILSQLTVVVPADAVVPGLEVRIDGQPLPRGAWGSASPIDPGVHRVEANAPGKRPWSSETNVTAPKGSAVVTVLLVPEAAAPPQLGPTRASEGATSSPTVEEKLPEAGIRKGVGLGVAGLGVALGVVGAVVANGQANEASDAAKARDRGAYDDAATKNKVGWGMVAGGVVLAGAGIAVALSKPAARTDASASKTRVGLLFAQGVWINGAW